jgi:hypothetical protein
VKASEESNDAIEAHLVGCEECRLRVVETVRQRAKQIERE